MESWQHNLNLVARAQGGDRGAFDQLVLQYTRYVESLASSQLGAKLRRRIDVDDIVQETFLQALRAIRQFRGGTENSFRNWLGTIAKNVVRDQARRQHRQKADVDREVSLEGELPAGGGDSKNAGVFLAAKGGSPSESLCREERFERLKEALNGLSPDYRQVIKLARLQGLSIKEVARRMERSEKATSVLLVRAMLKLRAAFGGTTSLHLPQRSIEEEDSRK